MSIEALHISESRPRRSVSLIRLATLWFALLSVVMFWPSWPGNHESHALAQDSPLPTWPADQSDASSKKPLRVLRAPLATKMPDFGRGYGTLGAATGNRVTPWRLATVIVRSENGWGSGAMISPDGWLITNYHVVEDQSQTAAFTGHPTVLDVIVPQAVNGGVKKRPAIEATLYRADPVRDLALLKLNSLPPGVDSLPYFRLAAQVSQGEDCIVIGSQGQGPAWMPRGRRAGTGV